MRKELAGALAAGVMLVGGAIFTANSAVAAPGDDCKTFVSEVSKPDEGHHGDWATVTFTRSVKVCKTDEDAADGVTSYTATFTDEGTFTATEGAKSPGKAEAVTLPAGITGTFTGGATFLFDAAGAGLNLEALKPFTTDGAWPSTSAWIGTWLKDSFVKGGYKDGDAWGWTYDTGCEQWVNSGAKDEGNITKVCEKPVPPACEAYDYTRNPKPGDLCADFGDFKGDPTCDDIKYRVTILNPDVDPWRLDQGGTKGIGCESKPLKFDTPPTTEPKLVTPKKPATKDPTCDEPPMYQNEAEGVLYSHVGLPSGNDWYTVGAKPKTGYKFPADAVTQWRIDIKWPTNCENPTQPPSPAPSNGGNGGGGSPAPSTSNASGELPVTGESNGLAKLVGMLAVGGILIAGGGLLLVVARRRRDSGEVESA